MTRITIAEAICGGNYAIRGEIVTSVVLSDLIKKWARVLIMQTLYHTSGFPFD